MWALAACLGLLLGVRRRAKPSGSQLPVPPELSVLVKTPNSIPRVGICCSKPSRTLFVRDCLFGSSYTRLEFDWGLQVFVGTTKRDGVEMFVASVPMGDSGSYLAFRELYSFGAEYICRLGSSDFQVASIASHHSCDVTVVEAADNLYSVMRDGGYPSDEWGGEIAASGELLASVRRQAVLQTIHIDFAVCHNTSNYHATNFAFLHPSNELEITRRWNALLLPPHRMHTSDMESASLFLAAKESGKHAITLLQKIRKTGGDEEEAGRALAKHHLETKFLPLLVAVLLDVK